MKPITVEVDQETIDIALQQDRGNCPVAIALKYADGEIGWVKVDRNEISFGLRDERLRYKFHAPAAVRRFVDAFDIGKTKVRPFTFTLDPGQAVDVRPMETASPTSSLKAKTRPHVSTGKKASFRPRVST